MKLRALACGLALWIGCAGDIMMPPSQGNGPGPGPGPGPGSGGAAGSVGGQGGTGGSGGAPNACTDPPDGQPVPCQVTNDCPSPTICLGGVCQPPSGSGVACDGIDTQCTAAGETCVGGTCQHVPGACMQNQDCPVGLVCQSGGCVPGGAPPGDCQALPPAPDLNGLWHMTSQLHFRQALSDPLALLLDAGSVGRSLISGDLRALGVPGFLAAILGPVVSGIVDRYVPPWAQTLIETLGDLRDIFDNMTVRSDVMLTGTCTDVYRGSEHWTRLEFVFRGMQVSRAPEDIPEIGRVDVEGFGGRVLCGELYIDRHRIRNGIGGLVRWVVDTAVNVATCANNGPCYDTPEEAVQALLDCDAVAHALDDAAQNLAGVSVYAEVLAACEDQKMQMIDKITRALDRATVIFGLVSLQGQGHVAAAGSIDMGSWAGSLIGGDFPGEFTATQ